MVRYWRWDLSDAIPVETMFIHDMSLQHLIIFMGRLSWRGVMGIAWRGILVRSGWDKSYMYNIWQLQELEQYRDLASSALLATD